MKQRIYRVLVLILISSVCYACASVNLSEPAADTAAKSFQVEDGKANIYIYRNENVVLNTNIGIEVDDRIAKIGCRAGDRIGTVDVEHREVSSEGDVARAGDSGASIERLAGVEEEIAAVSVDDCA